MSTHITPEEARKASDEDLTLWANRYRLGTGAHTVAINEIQRRAERKKSIRKVAIALIVGAIGLVFYLLKNG